MTTERFPLDGGIELSAFLPFRFQLEILIHTHRDRRVILQPGVYFVRGVVGGAEIGYGQSGFGALGKRESTVFGDRILPEQGGKPVVYSVRFLTVQR